MDLGRLSLTPEEINTVHAVKLCACYYHVIMNDAFIITCLLFDMLMSVNTALNNR